MSGNNSEKDRRLFYKFNISQRILLKHFDRETMNRLGVPVIQTAALFYLMKHDGCLLKDLSRELFQNKSATTTLVERMEKNGLVVKKKSETDGRASHLFLTERGRDIGRQAKPLVTENNRKMTDRFTEEEITAIHRFLDKIIENYR